LARRNVFSTADDQIFNSPRQVQVAVAINQALIAGAEPAVHEGLCVRFGIILVSTEHAGALDDHLATLIGAKMRARFVHDADANTALHTHGSVFAVAR